MARYSIAFVSSSTIGQGEQPMQVWSSGREDLHSLVMFVVDAARPFSTPAKFDH
jgi:hypothetical protein